MVFNVKYITLATLFVVALSQVPPQCVVQCSQAAIGSGINKTCTDIADPCVCDDTGFQTADALCLQANCTTADQAAAAQLAAALCGTDNTTSTTASTTTSLSTTTSTTSASSTTSMSMSGSMTTVTMATSSSTGTASSSAASPTKSNGANPQADLDFFTLGVAAAGAVVGGLLL
ncbi:hypothetical protein JOM56_007032 [Amanita muscaria]